MILAFVRLTTKPQAMTHPFTVAEALDVVEGWLARPSVVVVHPTDRHACAGTILCAPPESPAVAPEAPFRRVHFALKGSGVRVLQSACT